MRWARGSGRPAAEAPSQETPCHMESGTVVSRDAARPRGSNSRHSQECSAPVATEPPNSVSRL